MERRRLFPFPAIAGQPELKRALLLTLVHPGLRGVLIRGQRGTAKSTAVRALARLLPGQTVVAGCPYGCDPARPEAACTGCAERLATGEVPTRTRPTPLVELPVGATEDRVLGALDLERALTDGLSRFRPGLLAEANRGVLYVDEVNLLPDHLMDVLLDAAAFGLCVVEREGVRATHPADFRLIGTMNPEEGELRPQLTDRFDLSVEVEPVGDVGQRAEVVHRRLAFEADPEGFANGWAAQEQELARRLVRARERLAAVRPGERLVEQAAELSLSLRVEGHRAEIAAVKAACALAALDDRPAPGLDDLLTAARLAYPHRLRRQPFEEPADAEQLEQALERLAARAAASGDQPATLEKKNG